MQDHTQTSIPINTIPKDLKPHEDSQISTSTDSSNASSKNPSLSHFHDPKEGPTTSSEDAKFPMWSKNTKPKTKSSCQSIKEGDLIDDTVTEEGEEEEVENQFLKKLPVVADGEEFNVKKTHINRFGNREKMFSRDMNNRCRSLESSFLPLDAVEEDKNEEEQNAFKQRRKLKMKSFKIEDLNEFNQGGHSFERKERRNLSMQLSASKDVIVEEQENRVLPHLQSMFATYSSGSSRRGSALQNSPGQKLKVDEIDLWEREEAKEDDSEVEEIDTIEEETEEKNGQENKEFQQAKAKMNEEREFLKKIVMSDVRDENSEKMMTDFHGNKAMEEVIEEDTNENNAN